MSNITTFEQAKKLKELGFDKVVNSGYVGYTRSGELVSRYQYSQDKEYQTIPQWIKAPTVSETLQWIREKKGLYFHVCCFHCVLTKDVRYKGEILSNSATMITTVTGFHEHYPLAESALLDAVLTYLEKI